jgi:competence protein ComEA
VGDLLDVNTASQSELETLPGIGPSKAGAIIEHRSTHGPFVSSEQLDDVPGIGPATMSNLRPLVTTGGDGGTPVAAVSPGPVTDGININTASQSELETLPGIGPSKASAIIEYRSASGPFASCEDLARVSGIGPATVSQIRGRCTVAEEQR